MFSVSRSCQRWLRCVTRRRGKNSVKIHHGHESAQRRAVAGVLLGSVKSDRGSRRGRHFGGNGWSRDFALELHLGPPCLLAAPCVDWSKGTVLLKVAIEIFGGRLLASLPSIFRTAMKILSAVLTSLQVARVLDMILTIQRGSNGSVCVGRLVGSPQLERVGRMHVIRVVLIGVLIGLRRISASSEKLRRVRDHSCDLTGGCIA